MTEPSFSDLWYCSNQRGGRFRCLMTATAVPKSDIGQQRYRHSRSAAMGMHSPASTEPLNSNTNPLFQEVTLFSGSPRYQIVNVREKAGLVGFFNRLLLSGL